MLRCDARSLHLHVGRLPGKAQASSSTASSTVTVAQPVRRTVTDYLELTGNAQAVLTVQLQARVAGYLDKVLFQDGQLVKKDQLLFLIQQNTYQANLQQAEAAISTKGPVRVCSN